MLAGIQPSILSVEPSTIDKDNNIKQLGCWISAQIQNYKNMITMDLKQSDNILLVIGKTEGHLEQSLFLREILSEMEEKPHTPSFGDFTGIT